MNTKPLANHYDTLTPEERFSLILAAAVRGDHAECNRLKAAAPEESQRVPDYHRVATTFQMLSNLHYMEVLALTAMYYQSLGAAWGAGKEVRQTLIESAYFLGQQLRTKLAGWRSFCDQASVPADAIWEHLPGCHLISGVEHLTDLAAFTPREAAAYMEKKLGTQVELETPTSIAAELRGLLENPASH